MKTTRNTQQKQIILQALMQADHPTATELYESIHERYPVISRATVFRVLSQFAESGKINKLSLSDSSARFDAYTAPHAHAHCLGCGRVFDVYRPELDELTAKIGLDGFSVVSSRIEFTGYCKNCRGEKN